MEIRNKSKLEQEYNQKRRNNADQVAHRFAKWSGLGNAYHKRLNEIFAAQIPSGARVLEIGCGEGKLLASLNPEFGVGIDFSFAMLQRAKQSFPELDFVQANGHVFYCEASFDAIILSDLLNDLWDVRVVFEMIRRMSHSHTRIIINSYSRVWQLPLALVRSFGLARPQLQQNWLTVDDISNLLELADFEVIRTWPEILLPLPIPLLRGLFNQFLVKLPGFSLFALTNMIVARPISTRKDGNPIVSVVVPARNEAGNIKQIFKRLPQMGQGTELIFVEGHSKDDTFEVIKKEITNNPDWHCQLHRQTGIGKADAVRLGFDKANGDILMILDADLTVSPEDLSYFFHALVSNKGEFINGVRLVYPMEEEAMRFLNLLGNKFFSYLFSWLLDQPIKDTLCGTKVLAKKNYNKIVDSRAYFGDFDPFGDFDLLFGAARLNLKIVEMPIRYGKRTYGDTNIDRWRHGWLLLRMVAFAARKIKFI